MVTAATDPAAIPLDTDILVDTVGAMAAAATPGAMAADTAIPEDTLKAGVTAGVTAEVTGVVTGVVTAVDMAMGLDTGATVKATEVTATQRAATADTVEAMGKVIPLAIPKVTGGMAKEAMDIMAD